jgi:hypothetical protein
MLGGEVGVDIVEFPTTVLEAHRRLCGVPGRRLG